MIAITKAPSNRDFDLIALAFTVAEAAVMLGFCKPDSARNVKHAAAERVRRLIATGKMRARSTGASYIIPGSAINEYLDGSDEPIKHPDSA